MEGERRLEVGRPIRRLFTLIYLRDSYSKPKLG